MPWTARSFQKHNRAATPAQLQAGAAEANRVLARGGSEGAAVKAGNSKILYMRLNRKATSRR